jgi:hypothetical protein
VSEEKAVEVERVLCTAKHCGLWEDECGHFICPGCSEHCPFPTRTWESLKPKQPPSERMSQCGCGMTHRLTMKSGAVHEVPAGVTVDPEWRAKESARHRVERVEAQKVEQARVAQLRADGKCIHCEGSGAGPVVSLKAGV